MRSASTLLGILIASTILYSCTSGTGMNDHRFRERKEDGVPVAVNYGGPKYGGELFTFEHILTLHQDPENYQSLLQRPSSFVRGEDGNYYVVDTGLNRIVIYGFDGEYVGQFGRGGDGPGEFRSPFLSGIGNNQLHIFDTVAQRLTRYSTDGKLIDVTQIPTVAGGGLAMGITAAGIKVVIRPTTAGMPARKVEVILITRDGRRYASLNSPELEAGVKLTLSHGGEQVSRNVELPFSPFPNALFVRGKGILLSMGDQPQLQWYGLNGGLNGKIRIDSLDRRITQTDRERYTEYWASLEQQVPDDMRGVFEAEKRASVLPESKPPWTFIWVDDAGFYWLCIPERVVQFETSADLSESWLLLSPEGEYLGITKTPSRKWMNNMQLAIMPVSISDGHLMSISTDPESGEEHLNVYRMTPAAPGFTYP